MLNFKYTCDEYNVNGSILLSLEPFTLETSYSLPLKFTIKNLVSGIEIWNGFLTNPGDWSSYPFGFHSRVEVHDSLGNLILEWKWDPSLHGDVIHKFFNAWAFKNKGSFGVVIGTHDGTSGEWVDPIRNGFLQGFLIEASTNQYMDLVDNYRGISGAFPAMALVTPNGGDTIFYELGSGHINSVKLEHVQNYLENEEMNIGEKRMNSVSIVDLFLNIGKINQIKWLHLDVEGIDADLIFALDDSRITLPELIIYESLNLDPEIHNYLLSWFDERGFKTVVCGWNTLAVKESI
jgi:hypothetical protein